MGNLGFNEQKFREMLLYIAQLSRDDDRFGATKLNKILYYADFAAYRQFGQSISGADYQHLPDGPAPRQLVPVRRDMVLKGDITIETRPHFNGVQERVIANRGPNLSVFSTEELRIIDEVVQGLWLLNASQTSAMSHEEAGWQLTKDDEVIPYRTAWLSTEALTQEDIEVGQEIAKRHNLLSVVAPLRAAERRAPRIPG